MKRPLLNGFLVLALIAGATAGIAVAAGDPPPRIAFLARSDNPADALAAGAIAGQLGAPLFTTPPTSLAPEAQAGLGSYNPELVIIAGGTAAVSADVERLVETALGLDDDHVIRAAGANRHATAAAIVELLETYDPAFLGIVGTAANADAVGGVPAKDVVTTGQVQISSADWFIGWPNEPDEVHLDEDLTYQKYGGTTELKVGALASSSKSYILIVEPTLPPVLFGRPMQITGVRHCQEIFEPGDVRIERRNLLVHRWTEDGSDGSDSINEDTSTGPDSIADSSGPFCSDWTFDPIPIDASTSIAFSLLLDFGLEDVDQTARLSHVTFTLEPQD